MAFSVCRSTKHENKERKKGNYGTAQFHSLCKHVLLIRTCSPSPDLQPSTPTFFSPSAGGCDETSGSQYLNRLKGRRPAHREPQQSLHKKSCRAVGCKQLSLTTQHPPWAPHKLCWLWLVPWAECLSVDGAHQVFFWNSFWVLFAWKKYSSHPLGLLYIVGQSTASGDRQLHLRGALQIQTETLMNAPRAWKYSYMLRDILQNGAKAAANHPSSHSLNTAGALRIFLMVGATNYCLTARQVQPNMGNSRRFLQELSLTMLPYAALS